MIEEYLKDEDLKGYIRTSMARQKAELKDVLTLGTKETLIRTVENSEVQSHLDYLNSHVSPFERLRLDPIYFAVPYTGKSPLVQGCSRIVCRTTDHREVV